MSDTKHYPDIIEEISNKLNKGSLQITEKQARMIADAVFGAILQTLAEDGVKKIMTPIGVLSVRNKNSYKIKHPKTQKPFVVAEKTLIEFRPSNRFLRQLQERTDVQVLSSLKKRKVGIKNVQ